MSFAPSASTHFSYSQASISRKVNFHKTQSSFRSISTNKQGEANEQGGDEKKDDIDIIMGPRYPFRSVTPQKRQRSLTPLTGIYTKTLSELKKSPKKDAENLARRIGVIEEDEEPTKSKQVTSDAISYEKRPNTQQRKLRTHIRGGRVKSNQKLEATPPQSNRNDTRLEEEDNQNPFGFIGDEKKMKMFLKEVQENNDLHVKEDIEIYRREFMVEKIKKVRPNSGINFRDANPRDMLQPLKSRWRKKALIEEVAHLDINRVLGKTDLNDKVDNETRDHIDFKKKCGFSLHKFSNKYDNNNFFPFPHYYQNFNNFYDIINLKLKSSRNIVLKFRGLSAKPNNPLFNLYYSETLDLPLELFDDPIHERFTPKEIIDNRGEVDSYIYYRNYEPTISKSYDCMAKSLILEFDNEKKFYFVQLKEFNTSLRKHVSRMNIIFNFENLRLFQERKDEAVAKRANIKHNIDFDKFLLTDVANHLLRFKTRSDQSLIEFNQLNLDRIIKKINPLFVGRNYEASPIFTKLLMEEKGLSFFFLLRSHVLQYLPGTDMLELILKNEYKDVIFAKIKLIQQELENAKRSGKLAERLMSSNEFQRVKEKLNQQLLFLHPVCQKYLLYAKKQLENRFVDKRCFEFPMDFEYLRSRRFYYINYISVPVEYFFKLPTTIKNLNLILQIALSSILDQVEDIARDLLGHFHKLFPIEPLKTNSDRPINPPSLMNRRGVPTTVLRRLLSIVFFKWTRILNSKYLQMTNDLHEFLISFVSDECKKSQFIDGRTGSKREIKFRGSPLFEVEVIISKKKDAREEREERRNSNLLRKRGFSVSKRLRQKFELSPSREHFTEALKGFFGSIKNFFTDFNLGEILVKELEEEYVQEFNQPLKIFPWVLEDVAESQKKLEEIFIKRLDEMEGVLKKINLCDGIIWMDETKYKEQAKEFTRIKLENEIAVMTKNYQVRQSNFDVNIFSPSIINRAKAESPLRRAVKEKLFIFESEFEKEKSLELERLKMEILLERVQSDINELKEVLGKTTKEIRSTYYFGFFKLNVHEFKNCIANRGKSIMQAIMNFLDKEFKKKIKKIMDQLVSIKDRLEKSYSVSEELIELLEFLQSLNQGKDSLKRFRERIKIMDLCYDFFSENCYELTEETMVTYFDLQSFISEIEALAIERKKFLKEKKQSKLIANHLNKEKSDIDSSIVQIKVNFDNIKTTRLVDDPEDEFIKTIGKAYDTAETLKSNMQSTLKQIQGLNQRETIMNFLNSEFESVEKLENEFNPYYTLWSLAKEFNDQIPLLLEVPFSSIENEDIEENVNQWLKDLKSMLSSWSNYDEQSLEMIHFLVKKLDETKEFFPVIKFLKVPCLRQRHFDELTLHFSKGDTKVKLSLQKDFTLGLLRNIGMTDLEGCKFLEELSEKAVKEEIIEKGLNNIAKEWDTQKFPFPEVGREEFTPEFISKISEWIALVEDHQTRLFMMRTSNYASFFSERIMSQTEKIKGLGVFLEEIKEAYKNWSLLEPIFSNQDVFDGLLNEGKKFLALNTVLKSVLNEMKTYPQLVNYDNNNDATLQSLKKFNQEVGQIYKNLNEIAFLRKLKNRRLFFLSDEDVLMLLNPKIGWGLICNLITKILFNVHSVIIRTEKELLQKQAKKKSKGRNKDEVPADKIPVDPSSDESIGKYIVAIKGAHGEILKLNQPVKISLVLDEWIDHLEGQICQTLRHELIWSIFKRKESNLFEWVSEQTLQTLITSLMMRMTLEIESILYNDFSSRKKDEIGEQLRAANFELENLCKLSRLKSTAKEFSIKVHSLIITLLNSRDMVAYLIETKCESLENYEWSVQLKYHLKSTKNIEHEQSESPTVKRYKMRQKDCIDSQLLDNELYLESLSISQKYGFSYLGIFSRMYLTLNTQRYMTNFLISRKNLDIIWINGPSLSSRKETALDFSRMLGKIIRFSLGNAEKIMDVHSFCCALLGSFATGTSMFIERFQSLPHNYLQMISLMISDLMDTVKLRKCTLTFKGHVVEGTSDSFLFVSNTINTLSIKSDDYINFQKPILMKLSTHFRVIQFYKPDEMIPYEAATFAYGFLDHKGIAGKIREVFNILNQVNETKRFGIRELKALLFYSSKFKYVVGNINNKSKLKRSNSSSTLIKELSQNALLSLSEKKFSMHSRLEDEDNLKRRNLNDQMNSDLAALFEEKGAADENPLPSRTPFFMQVQKIRSKSMNEDDLDEADVWKLLKYQKQKQDNNTFINHITREETMIPSKTINQLLNIGNSEAEHTEPDNIEEQKMGRVVKSEGEFEQIIVMKGIMDMILSQLSKKERKRVKTEISLIFNHSSYLNLSIEKALENYIQSVYFKRKLDISDVLKKKIFDLFNLLANFESVILNGPPMSGKTTFITSLVDVVNLFHQDQKEKMHYQTDFNFENFVKDYPLILKGVRLLPITPRAYSEAFLMGHKKENKYQQEQVKEGLISKLISEKNPKHFQEAQLFLLDGALEEEFFENIRKYLYIKKLHSIHSDGAILIPRNPVYFLFETNNLFHISPDVIGRCAIIHMDDENCIDEKILFQNWLDQKFPVTLLAYKNTYNTLFKRLVPSLMDLVKRNNELARNYVNFNWVMKTFINILDAFFRDYRLIKFEKAFSFIKMVSASDKDPKLRAEKGRRESLKMLNQDFSKRNKISWIYYETGTRLSAVKSNTKKWLEAFFLLALVNSFGQFLDEPGKKEVEAIIRSNVYFSKDKLINAARLSPSKKRSMVLEETQFFSKQVDPQDDIFSFSFTNEGNDEEKIRIDISLPEDCLFNHYFDLDDGEFKRIEYKMKLEDIILPKDRIQKANLYIPTINFTRIKIFSEALLRNGDHILLAGPRKSGKTNFCSRLIQKVGPLISNQNYFSLTIQNTTLTSSLIIQNQIEKKLVLRRPNCFGPLFSKMYFIVLDDINLQMESETQENEMTQVAEFTRNWFNYGGWYDNRGTNFKNVEGIQFIITVSTGLDPRKKVLPLSMSRHFTIFNTQSLEDEAYFASIFSIYSEDFMNYTKSNFSLFSIRLQEKLKAFLTYLGNSIEDINRSIKRILAESALDESLSETSTSYNKNIYFDIFTQFKGLFGEKYFDCDSWVEFWEKEIYHATTVQVLPYRDICQRVSKVLEYTCTSMKITLKGMNSEINSSEEFGNADKAKEPETFDSNEKNTASEFKWTGEDSELLAYMGSGKDQNLIEKEESDFLATNLVMFSDFTYNLKKIIKSLKAKGRVLLLGRNGCGKRTLARLAIKVLDFFYDETIYTKNIEEWKKFILEYIFKLGDANHKGVLIIEEKNIESDFIIEGLSMLSNGQFIDKYLNEEERKQFLRKIYSKKGNINIDRQDPQEIDIKIKEFLDLVNSLLHIIIIVEDSSHSWTGLFKRQHNFFRESCIFSVEEWSDASLEEISQLYLSKHLGSDEPHLPIKILPTILIEALKLSEQISQLYKERMAYSFYFSRAIFLDLLDQFKFCYLEQSEYINSTIKMFRDSLIKIEKMNQSIREREGLIQDNKKMLTQKEDEIRQGYESMRELKEQMSISKSNLDSEKEELDFLKADIDLLKQKIALSLENVLQDFNRARDKFLALPLNEYLYPKHFSYSKSSTFLKIYQCFCMVYKPKAFKVLKAVSGNDIMDIVRDKKYLGGKKFKAIIENFNKEAVGHDITEYILQYLGKELNDSKDSENWPECFKNMLEFINTLLSYLKVFDAIKDTRIKNDHLSKELQVLSSGYEETLDNYKKMKESYKNAEKQNSALNEEYFQLESDFSKNQKAIQHIKKLSENFVSERERWKSRLDHYKGFRDCLTGDVLYMSLCLTFLSPLDHNYRNMLREKFKELLHKWNIEFTQSPHFHSYLNRNEYFKIRQNFSEEIEKENVRIFLDNQKWCVFCHDPPNKAPALLSKVFFSNRDYREIHIDDKKLVNVVEYCMRFGGVVVVQDVSENLHPIFVQIINKNFMKKNGNTYLRYNYSHLDFDQTFRLILISRNMFPSVPLDLWSKTKVVCLSLGVKDIDSKFIEIILKNEKLEFYEKFTMINAELSLNVISYEDNFLRVIQNLSSIEMDSVSNEKIIDSLVENKSLMSKFGEKVYFAHLWQIKINQFIEENFDDIRKRAASLYNIAHLLFETQKDFYISPFQFISIFEDCMNSLEDCDIKFISKQNQISYHFTRLFFLNIMKRSSTSKVYKHLLFLLVHFLKEEDLLKTGLVDLITLQEDKLPASEKCKEIPAAVANSYPKIHQAEWNAIAYLSQYEPFISNNLIKELEKNKGEWQNFLSEYTFLPSPYRNLKIHQSLTSTRILDEPPSQDIKGKILRALKLKKKSVKEHSEIITRKSKRSIVRKNTKGQLFNPVENEKIEEETYNYSLSYKSYLESVQNKVIRDFAILSRNYFYVNTLHLIVTKALRPDKIWDALKDLLFRTFIQEQEIQEYIENVNTENYDSYSETISPRRPFLVLFNPKYINPTEEIYYFSLYEKSKKGHFIKFYWPLIDSLDLEENKVQIKAAYDYGGWVIFIPLNPVNSSIRKVWEDLLYFLESLIKDKNPNKNFRAWFLFRNTSQEFMNYFIIREAYVFIFKRPSNFRGEINSIIYKNSLMLGNLTSVFARKLGVATFFAHALLNIHNEFHALIYQPSNRISMKSNLAALSFFGRNKKATKNLPPSKFKQILNDIFSQDLNFSSKREVVRVFTDIIITEKLFDGLERLRKRSLAVPNGNTLSNFKEVFAPIEEYMIYKIIGIPLNFELILKANYDTKAKLEFFEYYESNHGSNFMNLATELSNKVKDVKKKLDKVEIDEVEAPNPEFQALLKVEMNDYKSLVNVIIADIEQFITIIQTQKIFIPDHFEKLKESLLRGETPLKWRRSCLPSSRSLNVFINELCQKINLYIGFTQESSRGSYNIASFYNIPRFFLYLRMIFSKKNRISLEKTEIVLSVYNFKNKFLVKEEGLLLTGLSLYGATWDRESGFLNEISQENVEEIKVFPYKIMAFAQEKNESEAVKLVEECLYYKCPIYQKFEYDIDSHNHFVNNKIGSVTFLCRDVEEKNIWIQRQVKFVINLKIEKARQVWSHRKSFFNYET